MAWTVDQLNEIVRAALSRVSRRYVGVAVGAFAGDRTVVQGLGELYRGGGQPTGSTVFQIGSITKVFTALALADSVSRGGLALTDTLSSYLPHVPSSRRGAPMTLEHLATHTSGLPRLPPGLRRQAIRNRSDPYGSFRTEDLLTALAGARPHPEPGKRFRYSNFGAALLGEALSRHTGLSFDRLVAERITGPLHLLDTVVEPRADQHDRRATGHSRRRPVPDWHLDAMAGAGALYSTVDNLLALLKAHVEPDVTAIPDAIRLVQVRRIMVNRRLGVGLGWLLAHLPGTGETALWHNGGTGGFRSFAIVLPEARVGVVVLTNSTRTVDRLGMRLFQGLTRSTT